jgi:hypothetical protein
VDGYNTQFQTIIEPSNGGTACDLSKFTRLGKCPMDCQYSDQWYDYIPCQKNIKVQQQYTIQPSNGGKACDPALFSRNVSCGCTYATEWTDSSSCTPYGVKTQQRLPTAYETGLICPPITRTLSCPLTSILTSDNYTQYIFNASTALDSIIPYTFQFGYATTVDIVIIGGGGGGQGAISSSSGGGYGAAALVIQNMSVAKNETMSIYVGSGGSGSSDNMVPGNEGKPSFIHYKNIMALAYGGLGGADYSSSDRTLLTGGNVLYNISCTAYKTNYGSYVGNGGRNAFSGGNGVTFSLHNVTFAISGGGGSGTRTGAFGNAGYNDQGGGISSPTVSNCTTLGGGGGGCPSNYPKIYTGGFGGPGSVYLFIK